MIRNEQLWLVFAILEFIAAFFALTTAIFTTATSVPNDAVSSFILAAVFLVAGVTSICLFVKRKAGWSLPRKRN
jgi:hypothetical protein